MNSDSIPLNTKSPGQDFENDPRWLLVQRIAASSGFLNSPRLSALLLHVCRQTLLGNDASINERSIGETVFQRSSGYDPQIDNIVRSHASRLRFRLREYFTTEGALEQWRVEIPRGSYIPSFEKVDPEPAAKSPQHSELDAALVESDSSIAPKPSRHRLSSVWEVLFVFAAGAAVAAAILSFPKFHSFMHQTPSHKLWSQLFRSDRDTIIVPADSSLVIARLMVGHPIRLPEYAGGAYKQEPDCNKPCDLAMVHTIEELRYTSLSDLEFAVSIGRVPEAIANRTVIRFARDLEIKDLKESNLILAGSQEADPWLSVIAGQMNFVLHDHDDPIGSLMVENKKPRPGEMSTYPYDPHDPQNRGLATIAFLPNLSGTGNMLVVQGFTLAGTQAAAEFVTNRENFDRYFQSYAGPASALPHFEILLATMDVNGMASRSTVLACHTYP
jgi:hypothetical protein